MKIKDITESSENISVEKVKSATEYSEAPVSNELPDDVASSVPDLMVFPKLVNTDPYNQYRFGLAVAAAKADEAGEIEFSKESPYGEQLVVVARGSEEEEIIRLARKLYGADASYKHITAKNSSEADDVNKASPLTPQGPIVRKSNG